MTCRHLPRLGVLAVLQPLARCRRVEEGLHCCWRYPARLPAYLDSHVYIREEMQDVDCAEEPDGEVLSWFKGLGILSAPVLRLTWVGDGFGQTL